MEALYKKLYDKYHDLKAKKESELDQMSREQEKNFIKYMSAADDLVEHLKKELDGLRVQNNDLRIEVASIRSEMDEQYAEHQKLLMEEGEKNKELSEEIGRLQSLPQTCSVCGSRDLNSEGQQNCERGNIEVIQEGASNGSAMTKTRKRSRHFIDETEHVDASSISRPVDQGTTKELAKDLSLEFGRTDKNIFQPECCRRTIGSSDAGARELGRASCLYQVLIECLIGMKLSAASQADGMCITALHQSSGYSFSLTWVSEGSRNEGEVLYRVSSLGTFERVAPEWMRDVMIFSLSMCPVFFERISRVVKLCQ